MNSTINPHPKNQPFMVLFFISTRSNSLPQKWSSLICPVAASRQLILLLVFLQLSMESHYDAAPSMNALKVCADHSISNNDSINTDIAAPAPVTGYAVQMMIVMTQRGGRGYRWPAANQRAATSLARSQPPVPCEQQHLSLSPLLCPSVWFL